MKLFNNNKDGVNQKLLKEFNGDYLACTVYETIQELGFKKRIVKDVFKHTIAVKGGYQVFRKD